MIHNLSRFLPTLREHWKKSSQLLMLQFVRRTSQRSLGWRACSRSTHAKSSETLPCCFSETNLFMKSLILMNPCLSLCSSWQDHSTLVWGEKYLSTLSLRIPHQAKCPYLCTQSFYSLCSSQQWVLPSGTRQWYIYQSLGLVLFHGPWSTLSSLSTIHGIWLYPQCTFWGHSASGLPRYGTGWKAPLV